jgi:hypothetical protein
VFALARDRELSPQEVYWHQQQELQDQRIRNEVYQQQLQRDTDLYLLRMQGYYPCTGYYYPRASAYPLWRTDKE